MKHIRPDFYVRQWSDIPFPELRDQGFELVVVDADHTTLSPKENRVTNSRKREFKRIRKLGFTVGMLSNTIVSRREKRIGGIIASTEIPIISVCCNVIEIGVRPFRIHLRRRLKPWYGFKEICALAGVHPSRAIMIGDMLWYDIWGAQRAGFGLTILVKPNGPDNIWVWRRRRKEREPIKRFICKFGHMSSRQ